MNFIVKFAFAGFACASLGLAQCGYQNTTISTLGTPSASFVSCSPVSVTFRVRVPVYGDFRGCGCSIGCYIGVIAENRTSGACQLLRSRCDWYQQWGSEWIFEHTFARSAYREGDRVRLLPAVKNNSNAWRVDGLAGAFNFDIPPSGGASSTSFGFPSPPGAVCRMVDGGAAVGSHFSVDVLTAAPGEVVGVIAGIGRVNISHCLLGWCLWLDPAGATYLGGGVLDASGRATFDFGRVPLSIHGQTVYLQALVGIGSTPTTCSTNGLEVTAGC